MGNSVTIPVVTVGGNAVTIVVAAVAAVTSIISFVISSPKRQNPTVEAFEAKKRAEEAKEKAEKEAKKAKEKAEEAEKVAEELRKAWLQGIPPDVAPSNEQIIKAKSMLEDYLFHSRMCSKLLRNIVLSSCF